MGWRPCGRGSRLCQAGVDRPARHGPHAPRASSSPLERAFPSGLVAEGLTNEAIVTAVHDRPHCGVTRSQSELVIGDDAATGGCSRSSPTSVSLSDPSHRHRLGVTTRRARSPHDRVATDEHREGVVVDGTGGLPSRAGKASPRSGRYTVRSVPAAGRGPAVPARGAGTRRRTRHAHGPSATQKNAQPDVDPPLLER